VDDDLGTREYLTSGLDDAGFATVGAACGRQALERAHEGPFDLMLVDLAMPDLDGMEVVRRLQADGVCPPFILFSAFLTTPVTVEAMRLGAIDVIDKQSDVDEVVRRVKTATRAEPADPPSRGSSSHLLGTSLSVTTRWAFWVLRACESPEDLKTVGEWAHFVGTSATTLRECCRIIGVRARDARDLMRTLRVLLRSRAGHGEVASLLCVGDRRTLREMLRRAALLPAPLSRLGTSQFLDRQTFLPQGTPALAELRQRLAECAGSLPRLARGGTSSGRAIAAGD
jgi:DNA-binding response OmpR family regulator